MRTALGPLVAIGLLAAFGCVNTAPLQRQWSEIRSPNFSIYTTLPQSDAGRLIENLELFRAAIRTITKVRSVSPRVPTEIYAFESRSDYHSFQPRSDTAGFFQPTLRSNLVALSAGEDGLAARAILYHEYTHFLVRNEGRSNYPHWFNEGFADALSSVNVLGAMIQIGTIPAHRGKWFLYGVQPLPYSRVIRSSGAAYLRGNDVGMYYAQAWLLTHYLLFGRGHPSEAFAVQMQRYVDRLEQRIGEDQAFRDAFGIDIADLDERLKWYLRKMPTFGLPRGDLAKGIEISVRQVAADEIATRLGWLALATGKQSLARRCFERAVASNPVNARAIVGIAELNKFGAEWDDAEIGYRRALELGSDDWQNHLEFAEYFAHRAMVDEARREKLLAEARKRLAHVIELVPEIPEGHAMMGMTYAIGDQAPDAGIAPLERAAKLLPGHPAIEFSLAQLHYRAGHRDQALALLRRLVRQPHGDANREAVKMLEQLESQSGSN